MKKDKISTAEEFLIINEKKFNKYVSGEAFPILSKILKDFTKIHIKACKEDIIKNIKTIHHVSNTGSYDLVDEKSILNAYPEENIK